MKTNSKYFIIGSVGLHLSDSFLKELDKCKDTDVLLPDSEPKPKIRLLGLPKREYLYSTEVYDTICKYVSDDCIESHILPVDILLTLKLSHLHYDLKNQTWGKHFLDCTHIMSFGFEPNIKLLQELRTIWEQKYKGKDKIVLNKPAKDFFKQSYNQSHDELHERFKLGDKPAFKYFLRWDSEVLPSRKLFEECSKEVQFNSVVEEAMVIAFERHITLPLAFKKLITDLSKGWWNLFIITNLKDLYDYILLNNSYFKQLSLIIKQEELNEVTS